MIQSNHIYKTYGDKTVLEDVTFTLTTGDKVGLVAPNGTGKSTLLKIIQGIEEPDRGTVVRTHEVIGYLSQTLTYKPEDTIQSFLKNHLKDEWEEYKINIVLAEVDLMVETNRQIHSLSGGQKTKLGMAALLLAEPTTLLLDEPTNNLDDESLLWLEGFVRSFKGTVFVISHDRMFLDNTVRKIFELHPGNHSIHVYSGGYSDFVVEKEKRFENQMEEYTDFVEKKEAMEDWIKKKQQQLSVYRNPKVARQLQAMKTRFEREFVDQSVEKPLEYAQIKIQDMASETYKKKVIFYVENMRYKHILTCPKLTISGGDRVHLQGRNGAGKTTFIRLLLKQLAEFEGIITQGNDINVGYFGQEHEVLNEKKTVLDEFMTATKNGNEQSARKILASFLFRGNHVYTKVSHLSQGEKVKLIFAELTHQNNQFLILDEPTNHLDIESREVLENALNEYKGGFIIVSHDRYFLKQIHINKVLTIKDTVVVIK